MFQTAWLAITCLFSMALCFPSYAQVDSSSLLIKSGSNSDGVESGRYEVRKEEPDFVMPPPTKKKIAVRRKTASEEKAKSKPPEVVVAPAPSEAPVAAPPPSYADQLKGLVTGNNQPIEAYKEQVHPDDVRLNRIEIDVLPGLLYLDSKSSFSYRNFTSYSPVTAVGAEIWWTPLLGLYGHYGKSVGADITNNTAAKSRTPISLEMIETGLDFRKFFGLSRRANSVTFGFHYFESKLALSADSATRAGTKSAGIGIHFSARFPTAPSYAWILGAKMEPRTSHSETTTALGLQSGTNAESSRMSLIVGGEFKLSREHQLTWTILTSLEKNQFSGSANLTDPETSLTPQGVSVSQSMSLLTFGYRWGH